MTDITKKDEETDMIERKLPFGEVAAVVVHPVGVPSETPKAPRFPGVDKETRSKLVVQNGQLNAIIFNDGVAIGNKKLLPDITDVKVIPNEENPKVVIVYFADNTTEKAVLDKADTYSLEQGVATCITKKVLGGGYTGYGSSIYNKVIARAMKVMDANKKAAVEAAENLKALEAREQKIIAKKQKRREAIAARQREEFIEMQSEAFVRAMKKIQEENKQDVEKALGELEDVLLKALEEAEAEEAKTVAAKED